MIPQRTRVAEFRIGGWSSDESSSDSEDEVQLHLQRKPASTSGAPKSAAARAPHGTLVERKLIECYALNKTISSRTRASNSGSQIDSSKPQPALSYLEKISNCLGVVSQYFDYSHTPYEVKGGRLFTDSGVTLMDASVSNVGSTDPKIDDPANSADPDPKQIAL